jgi:hypothetical protein
MVTDLTYYYDNILTWERLMLRKQKLKGDKASPEVIKYLEDLISQLESSKSKRCKDD